MRVLIDECIDERFRNSFPDHDCQTSRYAGLAGLKNGDLLAAAETAGFEVFLTVDQGIEVEALLSSFFEQNRTAWPTCYVSCQLPPRASNPFVLARSLGSAVK